MERKWHDRLGLFLILALFLIEIPRYQQTLPDHSALVSLGMGIFVAGGAFYCVETWGMLKRRGAKAPARTGWLGWMVVMQIVLVPVIMTPAFVAQEQGTTVAELLPTPLLTAWLVVVTAAPVVVGGMVAFARSLQYGREQLQTAHKQSPVARKQSPVAHKQASTAQEQISLVCDHPGCAYRVVFLSSEKGAIC
jgi:hypothetical protein